MLEQAVGSVEQQLNENIAALEKRTATIIQTVDNAVEENRAFRAALEAKLKPLDTSLTDMFVWHSTLVNDCANIVQS